MRRLAVVLLSGGLDSTTVTAWAVRQGYELSALTVLYGQTHAREAGSAEAVAARLGVPHLVADFSEFARLASYSALTNDAFAIPASRSLQEMGEDIPLSYVPLRNSFFLVLAAAHLESRALHVIEEEGERDLSATILIAANAIDYSGYPDCRPEYYEKAVEALNHGSKLWAQYGLGFSIETPLIRLSKAEIVRLAQDVGAPLALTWSCYGTGDRPCGACDSCLLRAKGFQEAGLADPALDVSAPR